MEEKESYHRPETGDRRPETGDRFSCLKLQNEDLRQNALLDAKTLNSMGSSFCSFTRLKLQNEDPLLSAGVHFVEIADLHVKRL